MDTKGILRHWPFFATSEIVQHDRSKSSPCLFTKLSGPRGFLQISRKKIRTTPQGIHTKIVRLSILPNEKKQAGLQRTSRNDDVHPQV